MRRHVFYRHGHLMVAFLFWWLLESGCFGFINSAGSNNVVPRKRRLCNNPRQAPSTNHDGTDHRRVSGRSPGFGVWDPDHLGHGFGWIVLSQIQLHIIYYHAFEMKGCIARKTPGLYLCPIQANPPCKTPLLPQSVFETNAMKYFCRVRPIFILPLS